MKKTLLIIAIFALTVGNIFANPVDRQHAQQIGQNFMNAKIGQKTSVQLNLVYTSATRDAVDYYVFNNDNGNGFVIVAGDDRVKPILAYSTSGYFNPNDIADGFVFTLNSFSQEIQYIRENDIKATADIDAEWASVAETGYINKVSKDRAVVEPLCQTIWNQNFPWNSQCPEDPEGNGGHVYAGCVATAMGQVMKFWNWPNQGTGSHTYHPSGYEQQTANFGETEYHFELMPNVLDSTSTEEDYFYIAQFLHHCGISVDMQYSGSGSGAYSDDVPPALRNYFRYTCDDHITNYNFWPGMGYSNEQWAQMLKDGGIDEGMPLYYSGSDDSGAGGHAFVCDGYDENDYFHFNWGWSGRDDAWCPIGALNTTKYAFNMMNGFTGHIQPADDIYYLRPENITDFEVVENPDRGGVHITWNDPQYNLNGDPLSYVNMSLYRNGELILATQGLMGGTGPYDYYDDYDLEPGRYNYSIIAETEYLGYHLYNQKEYATILVGPKCDIVFELADAGGNGWKGAAISVTDETGTIIAVVSMEEGSAMTKVIPLLSQNLSFYWNHGWYHTNEQYDTDYECSFVIKNADDEVLYTSSELSDGLFLEYNNTCEDAVEEVESVNKLFLYPNPTDGIVNIEIEGEMTISVLNILGQKILEMNATDNATIDLSVCESGIYMIKIETVNGTKVEKLNKR